MKYQHKEKPLKTDLTADEVRILMQDIIDVLIKNKVVKLKNFTQKSQKIIKRMEEEQNMIGRSNHVPI